METTSGSSYQSNSGPGIPDPSVEMHSLIPLLLTPACASSQLGQQWTQVHETHYLLWSRRRIAWGLWLNCGSQPWLHSSIPGGLEELQPLSQAQPAASLLCAQASDITAPWAVPACSQGSGTDTELFKVSLRESDSDSLGWDLGTCLFNMHHQNYFFIQQVWEHCFKEPDRKPLCVCHSFSRTLFIVLCSHSWISFKKNKS